MRKIVFSGKRMFELFFKSKKCDAKIKKIITWLEDRKNNIEKKYPNYKEKPDDCYLRGYRYAIHDVIKKLKDE